MSWLPRIINLKLTAYEFGFLSAAVSSDIMKRMEQEHPVMWLQFQIAFTGIYANSDGHPWQKKAKKDLIRYKFKLKTILNERENTK